MPIVYPIHCSHAGCPNLAQYKIAARWTDGITSELKTYALTCAACLPEAYHHGLEKQKRCRLIPGEILEPAGIYQLERRQRDDQLPRLPELELQLREAN